MPEIAGLWLIVPVKPFGEGKSRLAPSLSTEERALLSRRLLERLLAAALQAGVFAGIAVISRDPAVRALASHSGVVALAERGHDLNSALDEARTYACRQEAQAIAVLPADLPAVTADDLRLLVAQAGAPGVVIVPSETGGTNALLLQPPDALCFAFGPQSFDRHVRIARERGVALTVWQSQALAFDVDLPADLAHPALAERA